MSTLEALLLEASASGDVGAIKKLIARGADVRSCDDLAFRTAAQRGHDKAVILLLDAGAQLGAADYSALVWAAAEGRTSTVQLLLQRGAPAWIQQNKALVEAARGAHLETLSALLKRVSTLAIESNTRLDHYAASRGWVGVLDVMRSERPELVADVDMLLAVAFYAGNEASFVALLQRGGNPTSSHMANVEHSRASAHHDGVFAIYDAATRHQALTTLAEEHVGVRNVTAPSVRIERL